MTLYRITQNGFPVRAIAFIRSLTAVTKSPQPKPSYPGHKPTPN